MGRPTVIDDRYELEPLSRRAGGMGEVWSGYDKRLDRRVAVKFIRIDKLPDGRPDTELTKRFVRESRITARLEHPGVPAVYDCGTYGEDLYLVMQLVTGVSLAELLDETEQGDVPVPWAAAIAAQVCSVLAAAHERSLVHRDLKPANVMLCRDGTVKVLDFGVAAARADTDATRLTATGQVLGTPEYMAPEQAMAGVTGPQSDLYSLGVVLDELLAGDNQFAGGTPLASARNHAHAEPVPLRARRPDVPAALERLVLRLLAKSPEDRPADATEVFAELAGFCRELPPFPGYVDPAGPHPVRMYAAVTGRLAGPLRHGDDAAGEGERPAVRRGDDAAGEGKRPAVRQAPEPAAPQEPPQAGDLRREEVARARRDAAALRAESRFDQAAAVLTDVAGPATRAWGATHDDVIELRIELADVLFLGGDYRRAAPEFRRLAADLAERDGPDHDVVLRCRLMEAGCHAAVGETTLALSLLRELLADERRYGVDEDRILELRRQIGFLEFGSGDRDRARRTLRDLLPDLERRYGPGHPSVIRVRELLDNLDR